MLYRPGLLGRLPCPQDWYFGSGPPTIDDAFTGSTLPGSWVFTRASANATNCLYTDGSSVTTYTTYNMNQPRLLDFGLLMEPQRTNLFLNSEAPVSQTITLAAGSYTVWLLGPTAASVAASQGTAIITGGNFTVNMTTTNMRSFVVTTAGTVSFICAGSPLRVQVENGPSATSYIVSSATAQTRAEDRLSQNFFGGQLNQQRGTYWVEFMWNGPTYAPAPLAARVLVAGNGSFATDANSDQINLTSFSASVNYINGVSIDSANNFTNSTSNLTPPKAFGSVNRVAMSVAPTRIQLAMDYVLANAGNTPVRPTSLLAITLGCGGAQAMAFNGYIRGFKYWPVAMPDAELKECTGAGYYRGVPVFDLDGTDVNQWRRWTNLRPSANGVITDATMDQGANTPYNTYTLSQIRATTRGLLTDANRSNLFPNSSTLIASGTASGLLSGQGYMVSLRGTGSITLSGGTATTSPTVLPAATQASPLWFMCTGAGTINWTATGTIEIAQFEGTSAQLQYPGLTNGPSSYIRTTTAAQFRQIDLITIPTGPWFSKDEYTIYAEVLSLATGNGVFLYGIDNGGSTTAVGPDRDCITMTVSNNQGVLAGNMVVNNVGQGAAVYPPASMGGYYTPMVWHKTALVVSVARNSRYLAVDGTVITTPYIVERPAALTRYVIGGSTLLFRRVRYYDYPIVDAELAALTTGPSASLDMSFLSGPLDTRITFTRNSTATYFDVNGTMQSAAVNAPRFDYDPVSHAPRGLLIEEQRTNFFLQSGDFTNASWTKTNSTLAAGTPGPNGATTGSGVIGSVGVIGSIAQSITPVAGTTYTISCFVRAGTQSVVQILAQATWFSNGFVRNAVFDLVAGTATPSGIGATAAIVPVGNNWYRCLLTVTPDNAVAANTQVVRANANGDGTSVLFYAFGAQIEAGANVTSYIPTTAATVTRAIDVASIPTAAWFNTSLGSATVDFMVPQSPNPTTSVRGALCFSNGTSLNRLVMAMSASANTGRAVITISPASFPLTVGTITANTVAKQAIAWDGTTFYASHGGSAVQTAGPIATPTINLLTLGNLSGPGVVNYLNGWVQRIRYWPRVLSSTEMQQVTT